MKYMLLSSILDFEGYTGDVAGFKESITSNPANWELLQIKGVYYDVDYCAAILDNVDTSDDGTTSLSIVIPMDVDEYKDFMQQFLTKGEEVLDLRGKIGIYDSILDDMLDTYNEIFNSEDVVFGR